MASELKKKTQSAIDALHASVDGCELAILIDRDSGLVLCKSSGTTTSQEKLEELASSAQLELAASTAIALPQLSDASQLCCITRFEDTEVTSILQNPKSRDDVIICRCSNLPERDSLHRATAELFELSPHEEGHN